MQRFSFSLKNDDINRQLQSYEYKHSRKFILFFKSETKPNQIWSWLGETASRVSTFRITLTLVNQPLRMPILSTRRSWSQTVYVLSAHETKYSSTTLVVSKSLVSSELSSYSPSNQTTLIKPSGMPMRSKSTVTISIMSTSNGYKNGKFQDCDVKFFVRNQIMTTHSLGKC